MSSNNSTNSNFLQDLGKSLTADPKKTGVLSVLVILLLVMAGRLVLSSGGRQVPRKAGASTVVSDSGVSSSVAGGTSSSGRASDVSAALQKWGDASVPPISRNLFAVRMDYFPVDGSRTAQSGLGDEGFWTKLEKSLALQADRMDKRDNLVANYTAQAGKLRVESTMMGPQPRAMVNGNLVAEGDVVAEFRILKIEARRIIVEREGIRLEIQMK